MKINENLVKPILEISLRIRDLNKNLTELLEELPDKDDDTYNLPESMRYKGN